MKEITRDEFLEMIENADTIDEVTRLRDMLESEEFEIECHLEMSSMVSVLESDYSL